MREMVETPAPGRCRSQLLQEAMTLLAERGQAPQLMDLARRCAAYGG